MLVYMEVYRAVVVHLLYKLSLLFCGLMMVSGLPNGPPVGTNSEICGTMLPAHGPVAQTAASPYSITASQTCYKAGDRIRVSLRGISSNKFKGFFVQARAGGLSTASHGSFEVDDATNQQLFNCFTSSNNAIGHTNRDEKSTVSFYWSPGSATSDITFTYTVVQEKSKFWVAQASPRILTYDSACSTSMSSTTPTSAAATLGSYASVICYMFLLASVLTHVMKL